MKATIAIGTPTYSEQVTTAYLSSVFSLQSYLRQNEPEITLLLLTNSSTSIDLNRNIMATQTLGRSDITHLLFIDADMGFQPSLIMDMLRFEKPLVGVMYPKRTFNAQRIWEVSKTINDPAKVQLIANEYANVSFVPQADGSISIDRGFARCKAVGAGIMMMQRQVLERMAQLPGVLLQDGPRRLLQCFRQLPNENGFVLSEDISFCRRWTEDCGGEIWVNVAHPVQHVGPHTYVGQYIETMNYAAELRPRSNAS